MNRPIPTPPTEKQLKKLKKMFKQERLKRLNKLDNKKLTAVIHHFKGSAGVANYDINVNRYYSDSKSSWNSVVMLGTERQRCEDDTIDNITSSYDMEITPQMEQDYINNGKNLIIYY